MTKTVILTDSSTMVNCDGSQLSFAESHLNFQLFYSDHQIVMILVMTIMTINVHDDHDDDTPMTVGVVPIELDRLLSVPSLQIELLSALIHLNL